jgi:hypothetical protein
MTEVLAIMFRIFSYKDIVNFDLCFVFTLDARARSLFVPCAAERKSLYD